MNYTTTITSRGQITIPKVVREKLGIKNGVKIDIYPTRDGFWENHKENPESWNLPVI